MKITTLDSLNLRRDPEKAEKPPETPEAPVATERRTSKGEARYEAISASISKAGEKVSGWWQRGKELFKAGAVGVLSAPEVAVAGYEFGKERWDNAKKFAGAKKEQAANYLNEKVQWAEAVANLAVDKSVEGLGKARDGIAKGYGKMVEYGRGAVDSAVIRGQQVKEGFNRKKNAFFEALLRRRLETQTEELRQRMEQLQTTMEQLQATLARLEQFKAVEALGEKITS